MTKKKNNPEHSELHQSFKKKKKSFLKHWKKFLLLFLISVNSKLFWLTKSFALKKAAILEIKTFIIIKFIYLYSERNFLKLFKKKFL